MRTKSPSRRVNAAMLIVALMAVLAVSATAVSATAASRSSSSSRDSKLTNKTIGYLDIFASAPIEARFYKAFKAAANHIGWKVQLEDAAGVEGSAISGMRTLVDDGVNAIVTSSIPALWVRSPAALAKAKGIPLINLITKTTPGVFNGDIDENETPIGTALAKKIIADHPHGAQVAIIYEGVVAAEVARVAAMQKTFAGTNIKVVATHNQPETDAPGTAKTVTDLLDAQPGINVFVTTSDIDAQYALAGLRTAADKTAKVYGYYAEATEVALLKSNPQFAAVVDSNIAVAPYIAIGQLLKKFSGGSIASQQYVKETPVIVTKKNINAAEEQNEGPIPYSKLAAPFYAQWKSKYGLG